MNIRKIIKFVEGVIRVYRLSGGFHEEERKMLDLHYTSIKKIGIEALQIVMMVDGRCVHGGLADRIRGIVTVYDYCKEKGIPFYLHYVYPFKLEDYFEPNRYDWRITDKQISYHPEEALPVLLQVKLLPNKLHRLYLNHLITKYPERQLHIYSNALFADSRFSQNFSDLFRPTFRLQEALSVQVTHISEPYIAMVFRFQQLLGDFKEDGYQILSVRKQKELIEKCINKVEELYVLYHSGQKILVTSDSITFLETIKKQKNYVSIIPGKVVHMDYTSEAEYEVYMKSFIDLLMLSKAEKIYLLQTGDMYRSGFAKRAAKINNAPYEEIVF